MAKKYITNTGDIVDWNKIISDLDNCVGSVYGYESDYEYDTTKQRIESGGEQSLEYDYLRDPQGEIQKAFENNRENLEFTSYTRENAYGKELDKKIGKHLGCEIFLSWISKVDPGKCVAPHIDDEEIYFANSRHPKENLVRYHIHVSKPNMGAAFFIGEDCYYHEEQGSVFQWPAIDSLHCGMNAGTKPKFLYHAIGVIRHED